MAVTYRLGVHRATLGRALSRGEQQDAAAGVQDCKT